MKNYGYLTQVIEGLPGRNPQEDLEWLREKLQPRLSSEGRLDLGDEVSLSVHSDGVRIEHPDLPVQRIGTARTTIIKVYCINADPYRGNNGFQTFALYDAGAHGWGGHANLKYCLQAYLKENPPRHERERRMQVELTQLQQQCRELENELEQAREKAVNAETLQERISALEAVARQAASAIWETRRFVKSRRFAQIRRMLESA